MSSRAMINDMKSFLKRYQCQLILIALFFLQFLFINPRGEFALNDDWVHTETIKHWVETGEFRLMPFAGPTFMCRRSWRHRQVTGFSLF